MKPDLIGALNVYSQASHYVYSSGFAAEVEWQRKVRFSEFSEQEILREAAWVIMCSGFRESVVRRIFNHISLCFCDWESASSIVKAGSVCMNSAAASFRNSAKLEAIFEVARLVDRIGFNSFKAAVLRDPIQELMQIPFIGPVTVWHLAKNLGMNTSKPDRHLVRVSNKLGFRDVDDFCAGIANVSGEEPKVIDIIIWRYLANNPKSLEGIV